MSRRTFMLVGSLLAFAVASVALLFPAALLETKGVAPNAAVIVWLREVGVLIAAAGLTTFLARNSNDPIALRAVLLGGAALHLGLLPIELIAVARGVLGHASGVAPNSIVHLALALGSLHFVRTLPAPSELG